MPVAFAAIAAAKKYPGRFVVGKVMQYDIAVDRTQYGIWRNGNIYRGPIATMTASSRPRHAILSTIGSSMRKVSQCREIVSGNENDIAAFTAIAAIRAAPRNVFLASKRNASIAPISGLDDNDRLVDEGTQY